MKNFKRTLALVLAVIMVAGMFASVSAAKAKWYADAVRYVEGVGIATIGATADEKITRDEFVLWIAKLESGVLNDAYWSAAIETPFTDITEDNNQTAIWYSARRGLIVGNGDGTFSPDKNLTFAEAAAVVVRLMRYTSKVEGTAEEWQWAYMDVANEYCNAFDNTFLDKVGGSIYDYDYELTKGEAAYIIATIMNAPVIPGYQTKNDYDKTVYKALTIDGMNLGERFYSREGSFGVSGNTYMISEIAFDEEDGTVAGTVVLTAVSAKANVSEIELTASDFTKFVRVSLGLTAEKAEDETEIRVVDTVKIGNLVDVVLNKNNTVASLKVHSGSKVVDTHVVMDSMLGIEYPNGNGIANWTADSIVSGASNSNEYRDAIINGTWSSDLLFTWDGTKLVFGGTKYAFSQKQIAGADTANDTTDDVYVVNGDLTVYEEKDNVLVQITNTKDDETTTTKDERYVLTTDKLKTLIPDVATGEVTLIFNDQDLDGKYDTLVITADHRSNFKVKFVDNETISDKYYNEGWFIDTKTASGKLQLLVLAQGRFGHYSIEDKDSNDTTKNTSVKDEYAAGEIDGEKGDYGRNYMNPYQVIDLATISSGVIEESTLKTFNGDETYYVVTVKNAAGAREKLYIPYEMPTQDEGVPTFEYTINGVTKKYTPDNWTVSEKLEFVTTARNLTGIETVDGDTNAYAKYAAKLVGQYISYVVVNNKVVYCVQGTSATGETGYLLDVEATDVANMYNITIANVNDLGAVSDVKIYAVNATASAMMNADKYDAIAAIFNKGNVHKTTDLGVAIRNTIVKDAEGNNVTVSDYINGTVSALMPVSVSSNGTFSYITIKNTATAINYTAYDLATLLSTTPTVITGTDGKAVTTVKYYNKTTGDELTVANGGLAKDKNGKLYIAVTENTGAAGTAGSEYAAERTYAGEFYSRPLYVYDVENEKWILCVDTNTVTVTYTFGVDSTAVTKSNYKTISDTALRTILAKAIDGADSYAYKGWLSVHLNANGSVTSYDVYDGTGADNTYIASPTGYTVPAAVGFDADNNVVVTYDFRGIDKQVKVSIANKVAYYTDSNSAKVYNPVTANATNSLGWYTLTGTEKVDASVYTADMTTAISKVFISSADGITTKSASVRTNVSATSVLTRTIADAQSSISNVAFTAMDKTETGYIPGSYWFTLADSAKLYFAGADIDNGQYKYSKHEAITPAEATTLTKAGYAVNSTAIKFRTTVNTEVVLLTPTATGYSVKVMTPAEAAAKDLVVTHYSFVMPEQLDKDEDNLVDVEAAVAYNKYNNYNNKLDAIILIGQEALVATAPETDDGKDVSEGEYLVYVPSDTETILVAPEGSKTVKVASTKSVYAIPSGIEIGSIYYEYDVYTGAEAAKIKTSIKSGWYVVTENGEIIDGFGMYKQDSTGKNGVYQRANTVVSVKDDKVVGTYYVLDKNGNKTGATETFDLENATLLYKDVDGTLKVVADKDAKFASDSIFEIEMKSAKDAVKSAYEAAYEKTWSSSSKKAEKIAAYEAAVAAYNETLAANIDKFFNGNVWDSFKATVEKEISIQGTGTHTVNVYVVDGEVFVILNDWTLIDLADDEAVDKDSKYFYADVKSNLK